MAISSLRIRRKEAVVHDLLPGIVLGQGFIVTREVRLLEGRVLTRRVGRVAKHDLLAAQLPQVPLLLERRYDRAEGDGGYLEKWPLLAGAPSWSLSVLIPPIVKQPMSGCMVMLLVRER
jgi:hypothetical protein